MLHNRLFTKSDNKNNCLDDIYGELQQAEKILKMRGQCRDGRFLGAVMFFQSHSFWEEGFAVTLFRATWMQRSVTEGALQFIYSFMYVVGDTVQHTFF